MPNCPNLLLSQYKQNWGQFFYWIKLIGFLSCICGGKLWTKIIFEVFPALRFVANLMFRWNYWKFSIWFTKPFSGPHNYSMWFYHKAFPLFSKLTTYKMEAFPLYFCYGCLIPYKNSLFQDINLNVSYKDSSSYTVMPELHFLDI